MKSFPQLKLSKEPEETEFPQFHLSCQLSPWHGWREMGREEERWRIVRPIVGRGLTFTGNFLITHKSCDPGFSSPLPMLP